MPDFLDDAAMTQRPTAGGKSAASSRAQQQYLPVPEDSSRVNNTCPICQERFEMKWLDEAQEWVWTDAVMVGERVYHASCHREAAGSMAYSQRPTPERVLGKRKAEVSSLSYSRDVGRHGR